MNKLSSIEVRNKARNGENFTTSGLAQGYVQTNVAVSYTHLTLPTKRIV